MKRAIAAMLAISFPLFAFAQTDPVAGDGDKSQELNLGYLESKQAVLLSKDELTALLPLSKVTNVTKQGSTRVWTNEANGEFIASTDGKGSPTSRGTWASTGTGAWHIADNGTYCVQIEWKKSSEQWCRYLYKLGNKYYGVKSRKDSTAVAYEYEISK